MSSHSSITTIIILLLLFHFSLSLSSSPVSKSPNPEKQTKRSLIDDEEQQKKPQKSPTLKKKPILESPKNQTKLKKTNSTSSTLTTTTKGATFNPPNTNNSTKIPKSSTNSTKTTLKSNPLIPPKTIKAPPLPQKPTKAPPLSLQHPQKPTKAPPLPPQNPSKPVKAPPLQHQNPSKPTKAPPLSPKPLQKLAKAPPLSPLDAEDDANSVDLIADLRDLLPDLHRISTTSKAYLSAANRGIEEGVKPLVGHSTASKVAPFLSSALLASPLLLLLALFRRLRLPSHLALHRLLLFAQAYLAIYFATLAVAALATGLEPLRFLFGASPSTYVWTQAVQTMAYLFYLVVQLLDLVAVFSGEGEDGGGGDPARASALAQMVIGIGVGVHYYGAVFHRAVTGEAPRANWRVHAVYATCFVVIGWCARAHRRKKVYEGEEDGKRN